LTLRAKTDGSAQVCAPTTQFNCILFTEFTDASSDTLLACVGTGFRNITPTISNTQPYIFTVPVPGHVQYIFKSVNRVTINAVMSREPTLRIVTHSLFSFVMWPYDINLMSPWWAGRIRILPNTTSFHFNNGVGGLLLITSQIEMSRTRLSNGFSVKNVFAELLLSITVITSDLN